MAVPPTFAGHIAIPLFPMRPTVMKREREVSQRRDAKPYPGASSPFRGWAALLSPIVFCLAFWLIISGIYPSSLPTIQTITLFRQIEPPGALAAFRWSDITPSTSLDYTPCYGDYLCARLSVPLNWNASTEQRASGPRAAIAVVKLPAKVPVTDPRYGGPIVTNPGGPGESGVYQVLSDGKHLQTMLDNPASPKESVHGDRNQEKYFDILSFDPRGVNNTTPSLSCFPDAFNRQAWLLRFLDVGLLWESESAIGLEWARAGAVGAKCSADLNDRAILPYVNTAQVVEDIVELIEQEGVWRAKEANRLLSTTPNGSRHASGDEVRRRTAHQPGEEKIQFLGLSYGTTVGSTFAAMHPDKIRRMVLDGNMDPADHYKGLFEHSLQDSDKVIMKQSDYCYQAGPEKCPLYDASPKAIESRLTSIMTSLKRSPIPVDTAGPYGPELVTYGDLHIRLLGALYLPYALAEQFWDTLGAIEVGNTSHPTVAGITKAKQAGMKPAALPGSVPSCDLTAGAGDANSCLPYYAWAGSFAIISCMDAGGGSYNLTREVFSDFLSTLASQSRWVSPTWSRNRLMCQGINIRPAWRPNITFERQEWDNTSHPILFIGNLQDPGTPLRNAERVSKELFPGSVVLRQDSEGHCSHAVPSLCTAGIMKEYFQTGNLPQPGTVCDVEQRPFLGCVREGGCQFEPAQAKVYEALVELADTYGFAKQYRDEQDLHVDVGLLVQNHILRA